MSRHLVEKVQPGPLTINGEVAHHLLHVLRVKTGERLTVFDPYGCQAEATVLAVCKDTLEVQVGEPVQVDRESPLPIALAFALSKGDKPEWIVQKAVELGVQDITLFGAERSVVHWTAIDASRKMERMTAVAQGAAAQCGRNRLPRLNYASDLSGAAVLFVRYPLRLVLHPEEPTSLAAYFTGELPPRVALLCGPEGGWTQVELDTAQHYGFRPASLGPRILRAETATLAAVTLIQAFAGDLGADKKQ